jgi:hypothetical protein
MSLGLYMQRLRLAEHQQNISVRLRRVGLSPRALLYAGLAVVGTWTLYSTLLFRSGPPLAPGSGHEFEDDLMRRPIPTGLHPAPSTWEGKADRVREAFLHAYHGWETLAAPADELLPLSEGKVNKYAVQFAP